MNYLLCNWLYIKPKWAFHAQSRVVHFGNRTNNRLENANGRLKKKTHPRDSLSTAIDKIWNHSEWLMREFEMQSTYGCDRHQIVTTDVYVKDVISRMTTFAGHLVLQHLNKQIPRLSSVLIAESKVSGLNVTLLVSSMYARTEKITPWTLRLALVNVIFTSLCGYHVFTRCRYSGIIPTPQVCLVYL